MQKLTLCMKQIKTCIQLIIKCDEKFTYNNNNKVCWNFKLSKVISGHIN
jgi:hypothetical protein